MRGGAIPLLAWGTILLVLYVGHVIWDPRGVPTAETGLAVLVIYGFGVAFLFMRREAVRRGPPAPSADPQAAPSASLAAVVIGLSVGCTLFGLVWARFLVYFGIAMLVLALGRLTIELRAERRQRQEVSEQ